MKDIDVDFEPAFSGDQDRDADALWDWYLTCSFKLDEEGVEPNLVERQLRRLIKQAEERLLPRVNTYNTAPDGDCLKSRWLGTFTSELACALWNQGKIGEACTVFSSAIELSPDNYHIRQEYIHRLLGVNCLEKAAVFLNRLDIDQEGMGDESISINILNWMLSNPELVPLVNDEVLRKCLVRVAGKNVGGQGKQYAIIDRMRVQWIEAKNRSKKT